MSSIITRDLLTAIKHKFRLDWRGIHGAPHWARVRANGLAIAAQAAVRVDVIELFAFLHDSCRENEEHDPYHGHRAAEFAEQLRGRFFNIDDAGFELLVQACLTHSDGHMEGDPTIQACWDADRLDLWRVGVTPDPKRLATQIARSNQIFIEAKRRALSWIAGSSF